MWITYIRMVLLLLLWMLLILLVYGLNLWIHSRKYAHLPGNLGFPVFGNLYQSLKMLFSSEDDIVLLLENMLPKCGGICKIWLNSFPAIAVSDPNLVEKLSVHPSLADKEPLVYENASKFWNGILTQACTDKVWQFKRRAINKTLSIKNIEKYHYSFVETSKRIIEKIKDQKEKFDVDKYLSLAIMESFIETHFNCNISIFDDEALHEYLAWGETLLSKTFTNFFLGLCVNTICLLTNINEPLNDIVEKCFTRMMGRIKDNNMDEEGENLLYSRIIIQQNLQLKKSIADIKGELIQFILLGSHAPSSLTATALLYLSVLPDIQENAWAEQKEIFGNSDREPTFEDVTKMVYLERICKETLRFISVALVVKRAKADIDIDGYRIPKDGSVAIVGKMLRMDDRYWKNPHKFDPDRFLRGEPPQRFKQAFSFFGYGSRNCPGGQYAMYEGKIILSSIIRRFKIINDLKFTDIKLTSSIIMKVEGGYIISVAKRQD